MNWRTFRFVFTLLFALAYQSLEARADRALIGEGFCSEVEHWTNTVADFTETKCIPAAGKKKGTIDLLIISEKPVFATAAAKKGWLLVVVAAVGKVARDNPDVALEDISVSDVDHMTNKGHRTYFTFPASVAKKLQREIYNGTIKPDRAFAELSPVLRESTVPEPTR